MKNRPFWSQENTFKISCTSVGGWLKLQGILGWSSLSCPPNSHLSLLHNRKAEVQQSPITDRVTMYKPIPVQICWVQHPSPQSRGWINLWPSSPAPTAVQQASHSTFSQQVKWAAASPPPHCRVEMGSSLLRLRIPTCASLPNAALRGGGSCPPRPASSPQHSISGPGAAEIPARLKRQTTPPPTAALWEGAAACADPRICSGSHLWGAAQWHWRGTGTPWAPKPAWKTYSERTQENHCQQEIPLQCHSLEPSWHSFHEVHEASLYVTSLIAHQSHKLRN